MNMRTIKRETMRALRENQAPRWQALEAYTDSLLKIEDAKRALQQAQDDAVTFRDKARALGVSAAELRATEQLVEHALTSEASSEPGKPEQHPTAAAVGKTDAAPVEPADNDTDNDSDSSSHESTDESNELQAIDGGSQSNWEAQQ